MKKARIALIIITTFALLSGALAFKTNKYNGLQVFTFTNSYTTFGTLYTRAQPAILPVNPTKFFTSNGVVIVTYYSLTFVIQDQIITLTRIGGTETITFPLRLGIIIENTFTSVVN